jgi:LPXTG-motif cell wall-anchored protein
LSVVINVLAAAGLAFTGASSHTTTYILIGIAAVVLGAVLVVGSRRRRNVRPPRAGEKRE